MKHPCLKMRRHDGELVPVGSLATEHDWWRTDSGRPVVRVSGEVVRGFFLCRPDLGDVAWGRVQTESGKLFDAQSDGTWRYVGRSV